MSPPPRSLTFVVSTSLLTASLSLGLGCDDSKGAKPPSDKASDKDAGKNVEAVNEGPVTPAQPEPPPAQPVVVSPDEIEPVHVNEGPEPIPEPPPPPDIRVNPGPPKAPEPKNVNTRPQP